MVLDSALMILAANDVAERILARTDALTRSAGRLSAIRPDDDRSLKSVCDEAATGQGNRWLGMVLPRRTGNRDYLLSIARADMGGDLSRALHVVMVDPETCYCLPAGQLQTFFGLTPAQGTLAGLLGGGHRLEEAATMLGIKVSTARAHLAEIFRKTRTDRIQALVRLLASLWSATQLQRVLVGNLCSPSSELDGSAYRNHAALSADIHEFQPKQRPRRSGTGIALREQSPLGGPRIDKANEGTST